jgi:hypothetical protein
LEEERELEEALRRAEEEAEAERLSEEESHVLCSVCGVTDLNYDEDDDENGDMIQCEECRTWQHNKCLLKDPSVIPDHYKCNVCDPENPHYKTLSCKLDPVMIKKVLQEDSKKKAKKQSDFLKALKDLDPEADFDKEDQSSDEKLSDDESDDDHNADDEVEDSPELKTNQPRKRSSAGSEESKVEKKPKRKKTETPPSTISSSDQIEEKAREAVTRRFEGMFLKLLPGHKMPEQEGSVEDISHRWAVKLEGDLFDAHHDRQTGKISKDYKEASTRIFVNVRDVKNTKLRNSIINRHIPFNKLVKMPVNELLNPDLRKEKEEAIKESMTQATLENVKVSNIRRTHKGDIVLENEEAQTQQFDFNVGVHLDENEKKFAQDETNVERKSADPVIPNLTDIGNMYDPTHLDDEVGTINDDNNQVRQLLEEDDDDLAKILGQTTQKLAQVDGYDPTSVARGAQLWHGQTIFTGISNFESCVQHQSTNLRNDEFRDVAYGVFDTNLPLEIEGRLDAKSAEDYLTKVSATRKLILLELKSLDEGQGFKRLWNYFSSKKKFGVVRSRQVFVKDAYLFPISNRLPKFLKAFPNWKIGGTGERLFIVLVVKQELLRDFAKTSQEPLMEYDAKSSLGPNEMALMQKIFEEKPETKNNPMLLVQYLQELLKKQS